MPVPLPDAIAKVEQLYFGEHPLTIEQDRVVARYLKCRLNTQLHTLTGPDGPVGSYARLGVQLPTGLPLPARALFSAAGAGLGRLDRLCRTLHVLNWLGTGELQHDLHLPVHPKLAATVREPHGQVFLRLLEALEVDPHRLWLILPAAKVGARLPEAVRNYRNHGFRVGLLLLPEDAATLANLPDADAWYLDSQAWPVTAADPLVRQAVRRTQPLRLRQGKPRELPVPLAEALSAWPA